MIIYIVVWYIEVIWINVIALFTALTINGPLIIDIFVS